MQNIELSQFIQNVKQNQFFIVDKNVYDLYKELKTALSGKDFFLVQNPEASKNISEYTKIVHFFLESGITRSDKIIAIGGGATSDLAGFVAATILRGINWEIYPTTLLAMVDAAIGGKVGINCELGKNLIGAFHLPQEIYLCSDFLSTLPAEEFLSGRGEILKYTFLDSKIFDLYMQDGSLKTLIEACANLKLKITEDDFKESHRRKILNLGHTFGHAIEKDLNIPHGLAVIIGLKFIIDIYASHLKETYNDLIKKFELNLDIPRINFNNFWNYLVHDKKRTKTQIELIIPLAIGKVEIVAVDVNKIKQDLLNYQEYETFFK